MVFIEYLIVIYSVSFSLGVFYFIYRFFKFFDEIFDREEQIEKEKDRIKKRRMDWQRLCWVYNEK